MNGNLNNWGKLVVPYSQIKQICIITIINPSGKVITAYLLLNKQANDKNINKKHHLKYFSNPLTVADRRLPE